MNAHKDEDGRTRQDIGDLGELEVLAAGGDPVRLASTWAKGPVVLAFVRHFG